MLYCLFPILYVRCSVLAKRKSHRRRQKALPAPLLSVCLALSAAVAFVRVNSTHVVVVPDASMKVETRFLGRFKGGAAASYS